MTRKPIFVFTSVGFGIASFAIAFALGSALTMTTGIPLAGGLLNGVLTAMVLTIGLRATRFFGSATLMWLVFSLCAVPTTTLGPPGAYKIVIGLIAGLLWDVIYSGFGRARWALYVGALVGSASIMVTLVVALSYGFGSDASGSLQRYKEAFLVLLAVNLIVTSAGVYLGDIAYQKRLSELPAFRNLQRHE